MRVTVRNNNVDQALRILKKKLQVDGLFNGVREREHFVSRGEKRRRSKAAGRRRNLRDQQKRKEELGL